MFKCTHSCKLSAVLVMAMCSAFAALPAAASDFPAGTYTGGGFTLAFDGNGHFRVSQKDELKVEGNYAVNDDQLQLTDKSGPWACAKSAEQSGAYRWKATGNALTFSKVADSCKDRVESLTPHPWKRQG